MEKENFWGYHLLLDCRNGNDAIKDGEAIKAFSKDLVETIDMVAFGEPVAVHFATHCADKAGFSLVQLIETSNITAHFVDKNGNGYIDVFSCKPFDIDKTVECVQKHFGFEKVFTTFIERDADNNSNIKKEKTAMELDYEKAKTWLLENKVLVASVVIAFVLGAWIF